MNDKLRILVVHNHYGHFAPGGEATVARVEVALLRKHGHHVRFYERANSEIGAEGVIGKLRFFRDIPWSQRGYEAIAQEVEAFRPDVMHVHNYKYLLSPSVFAAAHERGVATVHTLHNYRLCCPGGQLLYRRRACEDCLRDHRYYRILWRRCRSRSEYLKNILELRLFLGNRKRGLLSPWVNAYIALSEFARRKLVEAGLPREKIFIKPNFMPDPLHGRQPKSDGHGALFIGRLSAEKGLETLLEAWRGINYSLTIVGDGRVNSRLRAGLSENVRFIGQKSHEEVLELLAACSFTVFPSLCYEGFPLSVLESMSMGKAVIASDLGPRREIITEGENGLLFRARDAGDLREKVVRMIEDEARCREMGVNARKRYLSHYTPDLNYENLMAIYRSAMQHRTGQQGVRPSGIRETVVASL